MAADGLCRKFANHFFVKPIWRDDHRAHNSKLWEVSGITRNKVGGAYRDCTRDKSCVIGVAEYGFPIGKPYSATPMTQDLSRVQSRYAPPTLLRVIPDTSHNLLLCAR